MKMSRRLFKAKINVDSWVERIKFSEKIPVDALYVSEKVSGKLKLFMWSSRDAYPVFELTGNDDREIPEELTVTSEEDGTQLQLHSIKDISDKADEIFRRLTKKSGEGPRYLYINEDE